MANASSSPTHSTTSTPPVHPPTHFKGGLGTVCSSTAHVSGESFPSCVGKLPSRLLSLSTLQDVSDGVVNGYRRVTTS